MHCKYSEEYYKFIKHYGLTSSGTLMVEEDTIASKDVIRLSVIDHYPIGIELGSTWVDQAVMMEVVHCTCKS